MQQLLHSQTIVIMEDKFYSRATGKSRKGTHRAFGETYYKSKDSSTIYTIDDDETIDFSQYPMGKLSKTQKKYIESFLQGISIYPLVDIDSENRAIHWIGFWLSKDKTTMVSCSLVQPHISNATVHLPGASVARVRAYSELHFPPTDKGSPSINVPRKNPQIQGKFAIPLVDSMIEANVLDSSKVSWSNIVLTETEPLFIITSPDGIYECKLTHDACEIIKRVKPTNIGIVSPTTNGQNFTFRSRSLTGGEGTGPSITVHKFGTLQYQGKPESVFIVAKCFKECIDTVMKSDLSSLFINSLALIQEVSHAT